MKLLIVSATSDEILGLSNWIATKGKSIKTAKITDLQQYKYNKIYVDILITGVGIHAATYSLTKHLQRNSYDFIIQAGIAGSYDTKIALCDLVFVAYDQFADFGAEDKDGFLDQFKIGIADKNSFPYADGKLITPLLPIHEQITLPKVSAITVNTISGNEKTIKLRKEKYKCSIESMEGAAFQSVCLQEHIPFAQVRAISNYVIPRDKNQWKIDGAFANLNAWLVNFIEENK